MRLLWYDSSLDPFTDGRHKMSVANFEIIEVGEGIEVGDGGAFNLIVVVRFGRRENKNFSMQKTYANGYYMKCNIFISI